MGYFERDDPNNKMERYNSHLIINDEGQLVSKYRKMHLFDIDLTSKGGTVMNEIKHIIFILNN